jgi:hypothetical protein
MPKTKRKYFVPFFWFLLPVATHGYCASLYKEASSLGFREFSCLVENYRVVFHGVSSLRGNGAAVFVKYIAVKVLVFIKNYQAQVWGVVIFITLLAGSVPLLQVTFFTLLGDFYLVDSLWKIGTKLKDHRRDPYHNMLALGAASQTTSVVERVVLARQAPCSPRPSGPWAGPTCPRTAEGMNRSLLVSFGNPWQSRLGKQRQPKRKQIGTTIQGKKKRKSRKTGRVWIARLVVRGAQLEKKILE